MGRCSDYQQKLGHTQAHPRNALASYPWSRIVKTGVWLRSKEMKISATHWALRLTKDFAFTLITEQCDWSDTTRLLKHCRVVYIKPTRSLRWVMAWCSGERALSNQRSYSTSGPVSTVMGDCLQAGKSSWYEASQLGQLSLLPSVIW